MILAMVVLSTLLRFVQEGRSNRAAERLKSLCSNTATVLRRSSAEGEDRAATPRELPIHQLVLGDHIVLSAGDMIPSDCRVRAHGQGLVREPVGHDGRIAAGREVCRAQPARHQRA